MQTSSPPFRLPRWLEVIIGVAVLLELIAPFVTTTYGVDGGLHLNWIHQFTDLISEGVLLPRWAPTGFYGFGAATFYFYPPVTFYIASVFRMATGITDPAQLYQLTGLVATIGSFFTARLLLKSLGAASYQRNLGSLLYAFAPFRMAELYSRSSLSTCVAYAVLPLVWLTLIKVIRSDRARSRNVMYLAFAASLLILTNIPLTSVTLVCIAIAAIRYWKIFSIRIAWDLAIAGILTIGLTAFQLSSVLAARPFVRLEDLKPIKLEFLLTDLLHGAAIPAGYHVFLLYVAVALVAVGYWKTRRAGTSLTGTERILLNIGIPIVVLTMFVEIPRISLPVWESIPPFPLIQFGWRFYAYFVLMVAILIGVASSPKMEDAAKYISMVWIVGAIGPALLLVLNLHAFQHFVRPTEDATEYRPKTTVARTMLAPTLEPHELEPPVIGDLKGSDRITLTMQTPCYEEFTSVLSEPYHATFHRFYWPFWHLYCNGKEISSRPDSIGRATALLPTGNYRMQWLLERTTIETAGLWVSTLIASGILATCAGSLFSTRIRNGVQS